MSKLAKKLSRQIMAFALSVAMIMPNMTVYASDVSDLDPQAEYTVDDVGADEDAEELSSKDEATSEEIEEEVSETENFSVEETEENKDNEISVLSGDVATKWDFADASDFDGASPYNGLQFTNANHNQSKYLLAAADSTITVPIKDTTAAGKIIVKACHGYAFNFPGGTKIQSASGSTGNIDTFEYYYEAGTESVVINVTGQSYINSIEVDTENLEITETTEWNFITEDASGTAFTNYNGLIISGGKRHSDNSYGMTIKQGSIMVPVKGDCTITVTTGYTWDFGFYNMDDSKTQTTDGGNNKPFTYEYTGGKGMVPIIIGATTTYINSITVTYNDNSGDEPDTTYTSWNFSDSSFQTDANKTSVSEYRGLKLENAKAHNAQYLYIGNGGKASIPVAGDSTVTVKAQYGNSFYFADNENDVKTGSGADISTYTYEYTGEKGYVVLTVTGTTYLTEITVTPVENNGDDEITNSNLISGDGKIDVWDFGAEQLNTSQYNNKLTADIINGWYSEGTTAGSTGVGIAGFEVKDSNGKTELKFNAAGATNHRLRTDNTNLTRYDNRSLTYKNVTYKGYLYSNKEKTRDVNLELAVQEGDIVTLVVTSNGNNSTISFESPSGEVDSQLYDTSDKDNTAIMTFYAAETGLYKIYTLDEKLCVARIYRERPVLVKVSGSVTAPSGIPSGYAITFENQTTGVKRKADVEENAYEVELQEGYKYTVGLLGADEYIAKEGNEIDLTAKTGQARTNNITIEGVELVSVSGSFEGIDTADLDKLDITFENKDMVYQPKLTIKNGAYSAKFEKGVEYTVNVADKNNKYAKDDYILKTETVTAAADATDKDITFEKKPTYKVTIVPAGDATSLADLAGAEYTFYYIDIEQEGIDKRNGYSYKFDDPDKIALRDGSYEIEIEGGAYVQQLTSILVVNGEPVSKTINFKYGISEWDFTSSKYTGQSPYNGLVIAGGKKHGTQYGMSITNGTVEIPVQGNCKIIVSVGYNWDVSIGDKNYSDNTNSGDKDVDFNYTGAAGKVTLTTGNSFTSYIKKIKLEPEDTKEEYKSTITVGKSGCDYTTINDALDAVSKMDRSNNQRVTIEIQPGNYEEMLVVTQPNVTFKNASASPSIQLKNKGVDIDDNAVRITWYYGHGYTYYSMGDDCKYSAELLAVNKENGYPSYENPGAGTTNGSYWNASVVISANGFQAEGIIFENSFNQYVSEKSVEDTLVAQSGAKEGNTPRANLKTAGDTKVQEKAYVERATAIALTNNVKEAWFDNCSFVGRQDVVYGGENATAAFYDCDVYGAVDYIFGGMTAVFAKCDLILNTSDTDGDIAYITAPQQKSGRGYLMYNCHVTSITPGVDSASTYPSKPSGFGRAWQGGTSEAVFYYTVIDATDAYWATKKGASLITPQAWYSGLSTGSPYCTEYGTIELSGVDNSSARETTLGGGVLTEPKLADGSEITVATFLGSWNPFEGKDMELPGPVSDPMSNIPSGEVLPNQEITLTSKTGGAEIYYTTDGTNPSAENGTLYTTPIVVNADMTIKAIAVKLGYTDSNIVTYSYTVLEGVDPETFVYSPASDTPEGEVAKGTTIILTSATEGAVIYYTTDGTNPSAEDGTLYETPIVIEATTTIKAIAVKGENVSNISTFEYTIDDGSGGNGEGLEIILNKKDYTYTGSAIIPEYTVTYDGEPLIQGVDYTVKYSNNVKVAEGRAKVTVTGKGNLSGSTFETFNIKQKSLAKTDTSGAGAVAGDKLVVVEGSKATPVLTYDGKKLTVNKDFEFADTNYKTKKNWADTDNGTTVTVKAKEGGSFKDSRDLTIVFVSKAAQKNVKLVVKLDNTANKNIIYDGTEKKPTFTSIENKGKTKTLEEGVDYIVSYPSDIISAGKKTFTVTGISADCVGIVTKTYTIKPAAKDETKVKVALNDTEVSAGNTKLKFVSTGVTFAKDALEVTYDGKELDQGIDYKITYSANKKVGTAKYTVTGLGNYKGVKKTGQFTIEKAAMSEENVTVIVSDVALGKSSKVYKSAPYVIENGTNTLLKASNYKVTYCSDAAGTTPLGKTSAAGTAYVKIEGKGGYDSSTFIIKSYEIKAVDSSTVKDLSTAKITFYDAAGAAKPAKNFSYTGEPVQPYSMRITFKGKNNFVDVVLDKEADDFDSALYGKFDITFVNNTNKGTASVIVKADDDSYVGGKTATFKIAARSLKNFTWGSASASSFFDLFK